MRSDIRPHLESHICKQIFPEIYIWVTFPITTLIRKIWEERLRESVKFCATTESAQSGARSEFTQPALVRLANTPQPQWVELIAVLERCHNYAHTGAAKVLAKGLMDRIWPSRAIVQGLMPLLYKPFTLSGPNFMVPELLLKMWPKKKDGSPYIASKRTQVLTYGEAHFQVRSLSSRERLGLTMHG